MKTIKGAAAWEVLTVDGLVTYTTDMNMTMNSRS